MFVMFFLLFRVLFYFHPLNQSIHSFTHSLIHWFHSICYDWEISYFQISQQYPFFYIFFFQMAINVWKTDLQIGKKDYILANKIAHDYTEQDRNSDSTIECMYRICMWEGIHKVLKIKDIHKQPHTQVTVSHSAKTCRVHSGWQELRLKVSWGGGREGVLYKGYI